MGYMARREGRVIPWKLLDSAPVPGGSDELRLYQRDTELSIRVGRAELMNSRASESEKALAALGCARIAERRGARVLIGGLGMGFSARAALGALGKDAEVVIAELVPAVVRWNREFLGQLAAHPLRDRRVRVKEQDVGHVMRSAPGAFDAILLAATRRRVGRLVRRAGSRVREASARGCVRGRRDRTARSRQAARHALHDLVGDAARKRPVDSACLPRLHCCCGCRTPGS
jgi:hypothetical protein